MGHPVGPQGSLTMAGHFQNLAQSQATNHPPCENRGFLSHPGTPLLCLGLCLHQSGINTWKLSHLGPNLHFSWAVSGRKLLFLMFRASKRLILLPVSIWTEAPSEKRARKPIPPPCPMLRKEPKRKGVPYSQGLKLLCSHCLRTKRERLPNTSNSSPEPTHPSDLLKSQCGEVGGPFQMAQPHFPDKRSPQDQRHTAGTQGLDAIPSGVPCLWAQ